MKFSRLIILLIIIVCVPYACPGPGDSEAVCPSGWNYDVGCREPEGFAQQLVNSLGSGVFGASMSVDGDCMPCGSFCFGCFGECNDCRSWLEPGVIIEAYRPDEVLDSENDNNCWFPWTIEIIEGARPVRTAEVEDDGVYRLPLLPGEYALTAIDPIDGCLFSAARSFVVTEDSFVRIDFYFDHGSY